MMQYIIMYLLALFLLFPDELRVWELMLRGASTFPPYIEASHFQIMSANLTVYHPNIFTHVYP